MAARKKNGAAASAKSASGPVPPYKFPNSHRRHHDDEIFDEIHIDALPRYKTSGLSGDEWRVSYVLQVKRKGTVLFERPYSRLEYAIKHLPWLLATMHEGGLDGYKEKAFLDRIEADQMTCAQVGCPKPATVYYRFKEIFSQRGDGPLPSESLCYYTGFCGDHSERGDCGREDADSNYEIVSGSPTPVDEKHHSPSMLAGAVSVDLDKPGSVKAAVDAIAEKARGKKKRS